MNLYKLYCKKFIGIRPSAPLLAYEALKPFYLYDMLIDTFERTREKVANRFKDTNIEYR